MHVLRHFFSLDTAHLVQCFRMKEKRFLLEKPQESILPKISEQKVPFFAAVGSSSFLNGGSGEKADNWRGSNAKAPSNTVDSTDKPLNIGRCCIPSRKHAYIILTPLKPPLLYSKTGVYSGIHYFSYFCSKPRLWVLVRTASARRF